MCRLSAVVYGTERKIDPNQVKNAFHALTLAANADDAQHDGHGTLVCTVDGRVVTRSADPYWKTRQAYLFEDDVPYAIISHVRKASHGTTKSAEAVSHPFTFLSRHDGAAEFILAHNGTIYGAPYPSGNVHPQSDTYRAGLDLRNRLDDQIELVGTDELSPQLLEAWCNDFTSGSAYVFFIVYKDEFLVLRGKGREMSVVEYRVGSTDDTKSEQDSFAMTTALVFCTSEAALLAQIGAFDRALGKSPFEIRKLWSLPENTLTRVSLGQEQVEAVVYQLHITHRAYTTAHTPAAKPSAHTPLYLPAPASPAPATTRFASDDDGDGVEVVDLTVRDHRHRDHRDRDPEDDANYYEMWQRNRNHRPRSKKNTRSYHDDTAEDLEIRRTIAELCSSLNPLRKQTIEWWFTNSVSARSSNGVRISFRNCSLDQLRDFQSMCELIIQADVHKGDALKHMRSVVTVWNRTVPDDVEANIIADFCNRFGIRFWIYVPTEGQRCFLSPDGDFLVEPRLIKSPNAEEFEKMLRGYLRNLAASIA